MNTNEDATGAAQIVVSNPTSDSLSETVVQPTPLPTFAPLPQGPNAAEWLSA